MKGASQRRARLKTHSKPMVNDWISSQTKETLGSLSNRMEKHHHRRMRTDDDINQRHSQLDEYNKLYRDLT